MCVCVCFCVCFWAGRGLERALVRARKSFRETEAAGEGRRGKRKRRRFVVPTEGFAVATSPRLDSCDRCADWPRFFRGFEAGRLWSGGGGVGERGCQWAERIGMRRRGKRAGGAATRGVQIRLGFPIPSSRVVSLFLLSFLAHIRGGFCTAMRA